MIDHDDDRDDCREVDFAYLIEQGLTPTEAHLVLGGQEYITQSEFENRWELLQRDEQGGKA